MYKTLKAILFGVLGFLILNACQNTSIPSNEGDGDNVALVQEGSEQTPMTLDEEFLMASEYMENFAGLYYKDGKLNVAVATNDLSPQSLATQALIAEKAITEVFDSNILYDLLSEEDLKILTEGDELSIQNLSEPSKGMELVPVRYSFIQLLDWKKQVEPIVWQIKGVTSLDVNEVNNNLTIGAEDQAAANEVNSKLSTLQLPEEALVVEIDEETKFLASPLETTGNLTNGLPPEHLRSLQRPLVGGLEIKAYQRGACTLGFIAIRSGVRGFVTNSHCTRSQFSIASFLRKRFYQAAGYVGYEYAEAPMYPNGGGFFRWADAAFIRIDDDVTSQLGAIANTSYGSLLRTGTKYINLKSNPISGENVWKVGRTTGKTMGEIYATCVDVPVQVEGFDVLYKCQSRVKATNNTHGWVWQGDSGSAAYDYRYISGVGHIRGLKGINWAGHNYSRSNGTYLRGTFSPIQNIQTDLGNLRVHNLQKVGDRIKITLRYVKVHSDCDTPGPGDMYGHFDVEGTRLYTYNNVEIRNNEKLEINKSITKTLRYDGDDHPINITGKMKDKDNGNPDDWVGKWNIEIKPVASTGYKTWQSNKKCSSTLYYRVQDVGNRSE